MGATLRKLRRWGSSPWVEGLGRIGLVAKGISFALVGVLAILVALGTEGAATDRPGALRMISKEPYGFLILLALAFGFGSYATWRFAQALLDRDDEGNDMKGSAKRLGCLAKGAFYAGLAGLAISFLTGPRGESAEEPERTRQVFELPLGRWLILAAGLAFAGYGLWNGYRSVSMHFRKRMNEGQMNKSTRWWMRAVGILGHAARMLLFGMIGIFLVRAAWEYDAREAIGLDEALAKLAQQPHGGLWLGAAAAGLISYGIFSVFQARYRDV